MKAKLVKWWQREAVMVCCRMISLPLDSPDSEVRYLAQRLRAHSLEELAQYVLENRHAFAAAFLLQNDAYHWLSERVQAIGEAWSAMLLS